MKMIKFINKRNVLEKGITENYNDMKAGGRDTNEDESFVISGFMKEDCLMKNHKFWAWAMIFCLFMTVYTGYEHK